MRVTPSPSRLSSQLVEDSQRPNRNQHSEATCLLASDVRALVRTLEDDRKMRKMEKSRKSQTPGSDESEPSVPKKARRSRVKPSSKKFVRDSCSEDDDEEDNSDDVATGRSATSKCKKQLKVSKVSGRQSRVIFNFQTASQLHRESVEDSLRRSKEARRETGESENHHDEDDEGVEGDEGNRGTLDEDNATDHSDKSIDEALRPLSEAHPDEDKLKSQASPTARKRVWPGTERLGNGRWKAHCPTCTCPPSPTQQSLCL